MGSNELLTEWGREVLRENGYQIGDSDLVTLSLEIFGDGCCDLCYSESAAIVIKSGKYSTSVTYL